MKIFALIQRFKNRQGLLHVLKNGGWMMGEQLFRLLVGFFVGIAIARHLGPQQFGQLSFALSLASLFGICATLGLNRILVRELVSGAADAQLVTRLMSTVLAMRLLAAVLMYALCLASAWLMGEGDLVLIGLIAAGFVFSAFDCIELYFQAKVQARFTASARLLSFAVVTAIRIALLITAASVTAFAVVVLLEFFAAAVALFWAYRQRGVGFSSRQVDTHLGRQLLAESWPEIIAGLGCLLFMRLDQIMLQHMAGPAAVGTFAVAARLSEIWYFIPSAIVASTFPAIISQREIDHRRYHRRIQLLMTGLVGMAYLVVVLTSLLAPLVIQHLYGPAYIDAAAILVVHVWCGIFMVLGVASGSWILAEKRVKLNLYRNLSGAAINIGLNLFLIPRYGAIGAAFATLISFSIAYLLFDLFVPSMQEISRMKWRALLIVPGLFAYEK